MKLWEEALLAVALAVIGIIIVWYISYYWLPGRW